MYEVSYKNSYSTLTYYGYNEKELLQFRKKKRILLQTLKSFRLLVLLFFF